jgi:regulator of cell morphogenesis and NO signaling
MPNFTPTQPLALRPLGDLVSADARAAAVLERFGLDYCCNGHQTLADATRERGLSPDEVVAALTALGDPTSADLPPAEWQDLDVLTKYIVSHHHRYVQEAIPAITKWLDKLVSVHGSRHPSLADTRRTFAEISDEMTSHMAKEENILFPFINDLATAGRNGGHLPMGPFGTIVNPVRMMESDHQLVGDLAAALRRFTGDYMPPDDACTTFRLCYAELARFEADLHRHIHVENNILFPRAIELEAKLS